MKRGKKLGVFSGTFDPFHEGHLQVCLTAIQKCQLDKVVVLIEKIPLHKTRVSDYGHRMRMIELALKNHQNIDFLDINLNNITINTVLPVLSRLYEDSEYWLITGSDVLKNIANWNKVDELLKVMGLCIVNRNNNSQKQDKLLIDDLQKKFGRIRYQLLPEISSNASSSVVRRQIYDCSESNLLLPEVLDYINTQQLYKAQ
ncbi:nicotinate (nicotinamide) nucleotide adenylyltransferase [Candidatus Saccharibacteria bacterium]|nr:nicotinate (nicotinamide) nucleotide adenylyltransferase [Candidatus Saccharibacteria bacterium]